MFHHIVMCLQQKRGKEPCVYMRVKCSHSFGNKILSFTLFHIHSFCPFIYEHTSVIDHIVDIVHCWIPNSYNGWIRVVMRCCFCDSRMPLLFFMSVFRAAWWCRGQCCHLTTPKGPFHNRALGLFPRPLDFKVWFVLISESTVIKGGFKKDRVYSDMDRIRYESSRSFFRHVISAICPLESRGQSGQACPTAPMSYRVL